MEQAKLLLKKKREIVEQAASVVLEIQEVERKIQQAGVMKERAFVIMARNPYNEFQIGANADVLALMVAVLETQKQALEEKLNALILVAQ